MKGTANVVSGRPQRMLTALRTFSGFCDFTDSLWRSSFGSSVSIERHKTCIAGLPCGSLPEEGEKSQNVLETWQRLGTRDIWKLHSFYCTTNIKSGLLYIFGATSNENTFFKFNIEGHQWIQTGGVLPLSFCLFLFSFCP